MFPSIVHPSSGWSLRWKLHLVLHCWNNFKAHRDLNDLNLHNCNQKEQSSGTNPIKATTMQCIKFDPLREAYLQKLPFELIVVLFLVRDRRQEALRGLTTSGFFGEYRGTRIFSLLLVWHFVCEVSAMEVWDCVYHPCLQWNTILGVHHNISRSLQRLLLLTFLTVSYQLSNCSLVSSSISSKGCNLPWVRSGT